MKYKYLLGISFFLLAACSQEKTGTSESQPEKAVTKDSVKLEDTRIGIKMTKSGGVYQIPCYVNGVKMNFIFDTGASNVSISLTEAAFLAKNGYLEDDDYIGTSQSQIADGSVVENMEINLHSIEIEGIMLTDVKATVVKSIDAPLLLGQSALKKLGRIEMEGDSLFIIKKGKAKTSGKPKEAKAATDAEVEIREAPEAHWYDALLAKLGYEGKCEEYLAYAWWAYDNDLPEVALANCDKALELRKTAKAYGQKGWFYCNQFEAVRNGTHDYDDLIEKAKENLEEYLKRNKGKEDYTYLSGYTLHYDRQTLNLAWAYCYGDSINYDRALELAQEVYLRNPKSAPAMNCISCFYTLQEKYDQAEKWAKKLLDSHLDDHAAYCRLAYLAERQNRRKEAIRYYEKCLEIDSEDRGVLNNLGSQYFYGGNRSYGVELWRKAARLGEPYAQRNLKKHEYDW
ncbi:MAG: retroviral-like aspartic protease family protein [Bacteroidaceae bacterium]|nr:retroviral-like aspartic protease family protein [Bacteroidaceae bacterium]